MNTFRRCCRPGCGRPAVATLSYAYSESTAYLGPLAPTSNPHMWDLCEKHAESIRPPVGWTLLKYEDLGFDYEEDDDLTALAEAVREAGRTQTGLVKHSEGRHRKPGPEGEDIFHHPSKHNLTLRAPENTPPTVVREKTGNQAPPAPKRRQATKGPTRRGHLRVVPDVEE
ncbi:DUF3499 domain-containing protein [Corynebacterium pyruviciproducens]|uniref:DUF3499 domain-containing protein n=1 Tax=Corynebacterium pyruviciproducens TaxID=598660 RepID=A0AAF1BYD0_9CORY|nr:DUF3499 domain-containing protein [Corynebacterium pyruviciproducens]MDH4657523.1 DUF3499 domain-containing protein [Corynebacterium pyruviciproducens]WOT01460.1 DUF3499 domain-containing protein [Corynebacterium pyruviciproducens]